MSLVSEIRSVQDIRQLLKKYGTLIYTKDPVGDLELMEDECSELYEMQMLDREQYAKALLLLKQEKRKYDTGT